MKNTIQFLNTKVLFLVTITLFFISSCTKNEFGNPIAVKNVTKRNPNATVLTPPTPSITPTATEGPSEIPTEGPSEIPTEGPSENEEGGSETSCPASTYPIYAGAGKNDTTKATNVGSVSYSNDGINLYVKATYSGPTCPTEIHLWAGSEPLTVKGGGGLPFGKFPYKESSTTCGTYTFTIPLASILTGETCGKNVYIILHAAMGAVSETEGSEGGQTAIAYGQQTLGGARWGWVSTYPICCPQ